MIIGGQNWNFNRLELYSGETSPSNREEVIPPNLQQQVVEIGQVIANGGIPGGKIGPIVDTENAGITSIGENATDIRFWAGSTFDNRATAPFRVDRAGHLFATGADITGSITATSGTIGGFSVGADYIRDAANSFGLASTVTGGDDVRFWAGNTFANRATAPFRVTEAGAVSGSNFTITGGSVVTSILNGIINQGNLNVANRGWTQTCAFSTTSATVVSWGAGTLITSDGTTYNIGAGNTGTMSAKTYIYLATGTSMTAYQVTTTAATSVGGGNVLVAIAQNGTVESTFQVMGTGGGGLNIDAANIVAGSITANEIAASTITGANILTLNIAGKNATFDTGTIGGFTMAASSLSATTAGNTTIVSSGTVAFSAGPTGTPTVTITQAGVLTASGAVITGSITATSGTIGGFSVGSDYVRDAANSFGLASTVTGGDDVRFWAGETFANRATAPFRITEAGAITGSNITITGGSVVTSILSGTIGQTNLNLANRGWSQTSVFTVTDADTIAWGIGVLTSADGTAYNISAGNTGNMVAKTYIYLDIVVSTTAYQTTTTASTAVGVGKVMVAVAQNGTTEATFQVFQGQGGQNIDAASIVAGSITANEIAASTITGANILTLNISGKTATFDTGTIGGFSMGADYLRDTANSFGLSSTVTGGDDIRFWAGAAFADRATAPLRITEAGVITGSNITITGGSVATSILNGIINQGNLNLANRSWAQTSVFSVTDADTVAWGVGMLTLAGGITYSISAGNTGNMVAKTYIYLNIATSTTAYQITTTATTAVGEGKVLVAVAQNGTAEATFQVFQGQGGLNIDAANIVAGSITANEIAASTITGANILTLNIAGKNATFDTGTIGGFTMGTDYLRDTANSFGLSSTVTGGDDIRFWAGAAFADRATAPLRITEGGAVVASNLTITGGTITSAVIQTAVSGDRLILNDTSGGESVGLLTYDSAGNICHEMIVDGRCKDSYWESYDVDMLKYRNRYLNHNTTSTIFHGQDQAIITDGHVYTKAGDKLLIVSYSPLVFGLGTATKTGTNNLGRHWFKNSEVNQFNWVGTGTGSDFAGTNKGTSAKSYKVQIDGNGSPNTFKWSDTGGSVWNATGVAVQVGPAGSEIGGGISLLSADGSYVYVYFTSLTGGVIGDYWTFTSGAHNTQTDSPAVFAQYQTNNTDAVVGIIQDSIISAHFTKMVKLIDSSSTNCIWKSDGTTPNGALSGTAGDICIGADGGKIYHCTGTTNWSAG